MVNPLVSGPLLTLKLRTRRPFGLNLQSELPTYLNSNLRKKLQVWQWLISATPLEINHLPETILTVGTH
jgi:hypothetical protein